MPNSGTTAHAEYRRARSVLATMTAVTATWLALAPPADPPIRSDGFGYHLWLRAMARGRLDFCNERARPKWYSHLDIAVTPPSPATGRCAVVYPPGVALTKAPLLLPWVERRAAKDPGPIEQAVTSGLPIVLIGLILQAHLGLLESAAVDPRAALFAAALATFGTGLFHYASFDAGFSHIYSAFWAMMLLAAARLRRRACVVACASMLVLTRNTNVLLLPLVAVLTVWLDGVRTGTDAPPLRRTLATAAGLGLGALPGVLMQLALNAWFEGRLAFSSYWAAAGTFAPSLDHVLPILCSYERGIVTYYPALPVMVGATIAAPATRAVGAAIVATLLGYVALYSSWSSWTLGQGFGHRGFVEIVPLVALPCAVALDRIARRPVVAGVSAVLGAGAIVWCTFLMTAYWMHAIPFGGTTPGQYWDAVIGAHLSWPARVLIVAAAVTACLAYVRRNVTDHAD